MKSLKLALLVFLSTLLVKCASGSTVEGMTVTDYKSKAQISDEVFIKAVTGGRETSPFWKSNISNKNFEEAFKKSIVSSNVFSKISASDHDWTLEINLVSVDQPVIGFSFTVKTTIDYKLYHNDKLVFSKSVTQSGIATFSDASLGVKRLRLANEVSAKNNIKSLLESLGEMILDTVDSSTVLAK
ncbi:hypothetical protein [Flavobacterium sp. 245]|uniref:hypothetical protein n=1 Tax=Flavobacterium sp. 245 TaxID=2512115 RepID=UPI000FA9AF51|nr:hypothetical protein [Flavobacterium sp. 245]TDP03707.1 hypothetical protein EV145_10190 [Flavobacterium sp. 245]